MRCNSAAAAAARIVSIAASLGFTASRNVAATPPALQTRAAERELLYRITPDRVESIAPHLVLPHSTSNAIPNDPRFPEQWALHNTGQTGGTPGADVDATSAWDLSTGSGDVILAIIDTGFEFAHPDLAANVFVNPGEVASNSIDDDGNGFVDDVSGWDFVNHDADPSDDNGHGTLMTGAAAAAGNNGVGIAGLCWTVRVLPIKCLSASGTGTIEVLVQGIQYATSMGARVILAGWGGGGFSQAMRDAIAAAGVAGIPFVAVAGGGATNLDTNPVYPASYDLPNVVAVAATDDDDLLASFSSYGPQTVDLASPGVGVLTALNGGATGLVSGTGVAASFVAGAFGLLAARFPSLTGDAAIVHLLDQVDVLPSLAGRVRTSGRLNAARPLATWPTSTGDPPGSAAHVRLWWQTPAHLAYSLPQAAAVRLEIFDVKGRRVRALEAGPRSAGLHRSTWDGRDDHGRTAAQAIYVARLAAAGQVRATRIPFVR